eukprot:3335454-Heterocapsa_arctica.AAC.1
METKHIKRYSRRSESQQEEHQKNNRHRRTYRSTQGTRDKTDDEAKKTDARYIKQKQIGQGIQMGTHR